MVTGDTEVLGSREERVLQALRTFGASSRGRLCRDLGISRTAMSLVTADLMRRGAIVVVDTDSDARTGSGRPAQLLALDPAAGHYIGIDFRHRDARIVVADATHELIARGAIEYSDETPWGTRVARVQTELRRLMNRRGFHLGVLQQIGIGVPGPVLTAMARPGESPAAQPRDIAAAFEDAYGVPVLLDNNVRLAALGEAGAGALSCRNLLLVRIGTGVGGGMLVDGHIAIGAHRLAGEVGHIPVAGAQGPCRCGKRGCLETVASVPAIMAACADAGVRVESVADLRALAHDDRVTYVLDRVAAALVEVLTPVMLITDPDEIVLVGDLFHVVPWLAPLVAEGLAAHSLTGRAQPASVRVDLLGDDGGAVGALQALFHASAGRVAYHPVDISVTERI